MMRMRIICLLFHNTQLFDWHVVRILIFYSLTCILPFIPLVRKTDEGFMVARIVCQSGPPFHLCD